MATTETTRGPGSRSMIPVPKTYSLQRLTQTQSIDNLSVIPRLANRSPTTCRRITRHSSVSRLPTCRPVMGRSRPSMAGSMSGVSNSSFDLTSTHSTNSIKPKVSPKLFKPNENTVNCQRYQKNHNNPVQCPGKPTTSFKIYNKFSPYYENESLDSQNSDNTNFSQKPNATDFDCISSISSADGSVNISRIAVRPEKRQPGIPYHCQQRSNSRQSMGHRTNSVPEHIQQFRYESIDLNNPKPNETVNKLLIEKLKNRLLESIDNEDEEQELDDENLNDDQQAYEIPQNIEIKLLRIVIRHLREKLNQSKTNSDQLTQQLASSKQMCEAFQKSLSAMTIRAQHLTQQLDSKQTELDNVCHQLKDKNLNFEDLNRKYQLLDTEYKKLQKLNTNLVNNNINIENKSRTDSSMSTLSYGDSCADGSSTPVQKIRSTSSWLRGSTLSKAFKRRKKLSIFSNSSADLSSSKEMTQSVTQLKDLIREKELTINDLKLESMATTNRLERLEGDLKTSREETSNLKKNKDFLEKMIKMKIIE